MATQPKSERASAAGATARRRLPSSERRDQLARVALALAAERGYRGISLDEVAAGAGVTRNLLYHYFPRGRLDLYLAVIDLAGRELTGDWVTDEAIPLPERLAANFARVVDHAMKPTDAWLVHRQAQQSRDPELQALDDRYHEVVLESIALNHFHTADPPPYARLALRSYLAFAETALDECRERDLDPDTVTAMLAQTLLAVVEAATAADAP